MSSFFNKGHYYLFILNNIVRSIFIFNYYYYYYYYYLLFMRCAVDLAKWTLHLYKTRRFILWTHFFTLISYSIRSMKQFDKYKQMKDQQRWWRGWYILHGCWPSVYNIYTSYTLWSGHRAIRYRISSFNFCLSVCKITNV